MIKRWLIVLGLVAAPCFMAPRVSAATDDAEEAEEADVASDDAEIVGDPDLAPGAWQTEVDYDNQLFPSLLIATAAVKVPQDEGDEDEYTLGDSDGIIGIAINSPAAGTKIKVTIACDTIMKPSTFEGVMAEEGAVYYIYPKGIYLYEALHKIRQQIPVNVTFDVAINGKPEPQRVEVATLRSINDCPLATVDPETGDTFDMTWMIAAYVNENHPLIDGLLREALDTKIVDSFDGYQSEDPEEVYLQVFAVWNVMQRRGFKYSNITTTPGASPAVISQHVRFLDESLKTSQANCVDGSVLFASILRKIGLNVHLILVPGHCFLAFDTDENGDEYSGLETTMMGQDNLKDYDDVKGIAKDKAEKLKQDASYNTFSAAIDVGTQSLIDNQDKFEDEEQVEYMSIAVEPAREMGIMPIAYMP